MQSLACSIDVTAVRRYSDDEWLLQLEMYDMEHRHTDRGGNTRLMQHSGEFDLRLERDFFFVQRSDGTVTQCFYPPVIAAARKSPESRAYKAARAQLESLSTVGRLAQGEAADIVDMKKGMANHFRTQAAAFASEEEILQDAEDHSGKHNVT
jgi:hypothetical protein